MPEIKSAASVAAARLAKGTAAILEAVAGGPGHNAPYNASRPPWLNAAYETYLWWQKHNTTEQHDKIMTFLKAVGISSYTDWCSAFVNYIMQHSVTKPGNLRIQGTVGGRLSAGMAASWVVWAGGKQIAPRKGAITVLRDGVEWCPYYHVGFLTDFAGGTAETLRDSYTGTAATVYRGVKVKLLGGNQRMDKGYDGHGVTISNLYAPEVGAVFIWPKWLN